MKRKHLQRVSIDLGGKRKIMSLKRGQRTSKKDIMEVYNKFYRDQVAALYREVSK